MAEPVLVVESREHPWCLLHLALVANVMAASGAAPMVSRPNFPQRSGYFLPTVQLDLLPFGEAALTHLLSTSKLPKGSSGTPKASCRQRPS